MNSMDELWGLAMGANYGDEFKGALGMNPGDFCGKDVIFPSALRD